MKESGFEVGIIGGTGGMGRWCADLLEKQGYRVHLAGRTSGLSMEEMAHRCAVVIVSVPIESTASVVSHIGALLPETSLLMDMTSLKEDPLRAMLSSTKAEVMGCHPLFGPQADPDDDLCVVLCPGRVSRWSAWPGEVFRAGGMRVIETTAEKHDQMMALVQGLNHLNTVLTALVIEESGVDRAELDQYATPLFRSKLSIIDRVMAGNPRMYAEIITGNAHLKTVLRQYEAILRDLKSIVEKGDGEALAARIAGSNGSDNHRSFRKT